MKIQYGCDICDQYFQKVEDAMKCEKSHKLVSPTKIWFIPVVGHFLWVREVLKGNFVIFTKNELGTKTLRDWLITSPVLISVFIFIFRSI